MSIDLDRDELIHISVVPSLVPRPPGRPPYSTEAIRAWANRGAWGIKLEVVAVGRSLFTTREAVRRFVAECSRADARKFAGAGKKGGGRRVASSPASG